MLLPAVLASCYRQLLIILCRSPATGSQITNVVPVSIVVADLFDQVPLFQRRPIHSSSPPSHNPLLSHKASALPPGPDPQPGPSFPPTHCTPPQRQGAGSTTPTSVPLHLLLLFLHHQGPYSPTLWYFTYFGMVPIHPCPLPSPHKKGRHYTHQPPHPHILLHLHPKVCQLQLLWDPQNMRPHHLVRIYLSYGTMHVRQISPSLSFTASNPQRTMGPIPSPPGPDLFIDNGDLTSNLTLSPTPLKTPPPAYSYGALVCLFPMPLCLTPVRGFRAVVQGLHAGAVLYSMYFPGHQR